MRSKVSSFKVSGCVVTDLHCLYCTDEVLSEPSTQPVEDHSPTPRQPSVQQPSPAPAPVPAAQIPPVKLVPAPTIHAATQTDPIQPTKPIKKPKRARQPVTPAPRPDHPRHMPRRTTTHDSGYAQVSSSRKGTGKAWMVKDLDNLRDSVAGYGGGDEMDDSEWEELGMFLDRPWWMCKNRWEEMRDKERDERKKRSESTRGTAA